MAVISPRAQHLTVWNRYQRLWFPAAPPSAAWHTSAAGDRLLPRSRDLLPEL